MRRPELAVRGEPFVELRERLGPDAIQAPLSVCARLDEAGLPQHAKVLGHRRLADPKAVDELADRPFSVTEQIQDLEPPRLGEDLQCNEFRAHVRQYSYSVICPSSNQHGVSAFELGQPLFEEAPLGIRVDEFERSFVRGAGIFDAVEPAQKLGTRGMEVVVLVELKVVDET